MRLSWMIHRLPVATALGLLLWCLAAGLAADGRKATTHTVLMEGTGFQPETLMVNAGDTVVWVNKDFFPHTATSEAGGFDSGVIPAEKSWTYTPTTAGEFPYVCVLHPTMKGTLRVK